MKVLASAIFVAARVHRIRIALFDRHDGIPEDDDTKPLINRFRAFRQTYFL